MDLTEIATRLGLALALGFVIGLERGWKERDEGEGKRAAGLRTFSLIGLMGGIFGVLSPSGEHVLLAVGFPAVLLLLNEAIAFCDRRGLAVARSLRTFRTLVAPAPALVVFVTASRGSP